MAIFKEFDPSEIKTDQDVLDIYVDFIQSDISSSLNRRQFQLWVSGGQGPGVTSSLYQTVYDQDFTLQTANAMFDITFGLARQSGIVTSSLLYEDATTGKLYFPTSSMMVEQKIHLYRLFAQKLLGDADEEFTLISGSTETSVREPMFLCFHRLFARDRLKRETFGIKLFQTASSLTSSNYLGEKVYTDVSSSANREFGFGGEVSVIVDSANTTYPVGLLYLDHGIAVMDTSRIFAQNFNMVGTIDAISANGTTPFSSSFNNLLLSASIDDICDHVCSTRFSSSNDAAIVFQGETRLNSTYFYCNFGADEFNYSSNPTYTDSNNRINVIDAGSEDTQKSFSFITTVGGYDINDNLLWVAKTSRPIFKNSSRSFPIRVRLEY